jgi:CheY-like chemotaxis protein
MSLGGHLTGCQMKVGLKSYTDINMPGMDGYELAETAVQRRSHLKVILLSGKEYNTHGFPLIRKPFMRSDLERTMAANTDLC